MRTLYLVFLTFSSDAGCLNAFLKDGSFFYSTQGPSGQIGAPGPIGSRGKKVSKSLCLKTNKCKSSPDRE